MGTALQPLGTGGTCSLSQLLLIQARMEPMPVEGLAPQGRGAPGAPVAPRLLPLSASASQRAPGSRYPRP